MTNVNMEASFETPILFITFNRPNHTLRVWEEIKKQHPSKIYIFQDGPRAENDSDGKKCWEVRAIFSDTKEWNCDLKTYYSDQNLGCGLGPATAITWFFQNEEQGIIFEDDCLPSATLFRFYEELLEEYKNVTKVSLITGTNQQLKWKSKRQSYLFSTIGAATMGCWASWRRAWNLFDFNMTLWNDAETKTTLSHYFNNKQYYSYYYKHFDFYAQTTNKDAWDYQWAFARIMDRSVSIVSSVNQMSNIGFGEDSTHTLNASDRLANLPLFTMQLPIKHQKVKVDRLFDWVVFQRYNNPKKKSILRRITLILLEKLYAR